MMAVNPYQTTLVREGERRLVGGNKRVVNVRPLSNL
jgi:hypothetical protein